MVKFLTFALVIGLFPGCSLFKGSDSGSEAGEHRSESANLKYVTNGAAEFNEIRNAHALIVVDFWASWCPPCRALGPIFKEISEQDDMQDVMFVKVEFDKTAENKAFSQVEGVSGLPTLIVYKDGEKAPDFMVGLKSKADIVSWINSHR